MISYIMDKSLINAEWKIVKKHFDNVEKGVYIKN
tara:strand:+ start:260 stop:361 length:102 start_codon:yes stop_codon:yes gene_type:complete